MRKIGFFSLVLFLIGATLLFVACNCLVAAELSTTVGIAGFCLLVISPVGMATSAIAQYSLYRSNTYKREELFFNSLTREFCR